MFASSVTVGHGAESYIWILLLQRHLCPVSVALREFAVRPKVDLPGTFLELVDEFRYQFWDDRDFGSSIASSSENPDGASESR